MSPAERVELRQRCRRVVAAPVPSSVVSGSPVAVDQYKSDAAVCAAFARSGGGLARARFAVARLEGQQVRL